MQALQQVVLHRPTRNRPSTRDTELKDTAKAAERVPAPGGQVQECLQAAKQHWSPEHDGGAHKEVLRFEGPPAGHLR